MIYHVLSELEPFSEHTGGAISRWIANVIRDDEDSRVVCATADSTWGFPESRIIYVPRMQAYHAAMLASLPWRFRELLVRATFGQFAKRLSPGDVVYVHNRWEFVPAFRALVQPSVRIVMHMHNSHLTACPSSAAAAINPDLTVFCSRFLESEALLRLPHLSPTVVIANGADKHLFYPPDDFAAPEAPAVPLILFVGRLDPVKGVHVFIDALLLEQRGVRATGRIVGSSWFGSKATTAYSQRLSRNAPTNVEFLPYTSGPGLAAEFRRATIFCCPSIWNEAFGMVNVEAMASGLLVVATNVGGMPDIFVNDTGHFWLHQTILLRWQTRSAP